MAKDTVMKPDDGSDASGPVPQAGKELWTPRVVRWSAISIAVFLVSVVCLFQMTSFPAPWGLVLALVAEILPVFGGFALWRLAVALKPLVPESRPAQFARWIALVGVVTVPIGFVATVLLNLEPVFGLIPTIVLWTPALAAPVFALAIGRFGDPAWQTLVALLLVELVIGLGIRWIAAVQADGDVEWGTAAYATRAHAQIAIVTSALWGVLLSAWGIWAHRDQSEY